MTPGKGLLGIAGLAALALLLACKPEAAPAPAVPEQKQKAVPTAAPEAQHPKEPKEIADIQNLFGYPRLIPGQKPAFTPYFIGAEEKDEPLLAAWYPGWRFFTVSIYTPESQIAGPESSFETVAIDPAGRAEKVDAETFMNSHPLRLTHAEKALEAAYVYAALRNRRIFEKSFDKCGRLKNGKAARGDHDDAPQVTAHPGGFVVRFLCSRGGYSFFKVALTVTTSGRIRANESFLCSTLYWR